MITARQLNQLIKESNNCLYVSGRDTHTAYNPRIFKSRTIKGQLQCYGFDKWSNIPSNATFIDGRTGRKIN